MKQAMIVQCCPVEPVIELPVRTYPTEVYIPEVDPIQEVIKQSQANRWQARPCMMGIAIPSAPVKFPY